MEERGLAGVVLTHRLADQVLETLGGVIALPERISIRVVDNALCDDTTKRIARALSARQIDQCSVKIQRGVAQSRRHTRGDGICGALQLGQLTDLRPAVARGRDGQRRDTRFTGALTDQGLLAATNKRSYRSLS